jgi:hypothetical protein
MNVSILHSDVLAIREEALRRTSFGGDQKWYADRRRRMSGCGPTCAANLTAYLALTQQALRALYAGEDMCKTQFSAHMEAVYEFVTPRFMGLSRVEMFTGGVESFAASRGLSLKAHVFEARGNTRGDRPPVAELARFVREGLDADCPVAFLNLAKGRVKNIQSWHWITIVGADISDSSLYARASDEGAEICFDLGLWYLSTRLRGGLVYFTAS